MADVPGGLQSSLATLIAEHDPSETQAGHVVAHLLVEHPLVGRLGIEVAVDRLQRWGLGPEAARDAARDLLAFELLGRHSYERALAELGQRFGPGLALGACLRAAARRRALRGTAPLEEQRPLRAWLARFAQGWLR